MRREESGQPVLTFRTRSQAAYTTLSVMHRIAVKSELKGHKSDCSRCKEYAMKHIFPCAEPVS